MNDGEAKLKKLRTFYDDMTRLQSGSPTEAFSSDTKADPLMAARIKGSKVSAELPEEPPPPPKPVTIIEAPKPQVEIPIKPPPLPQPLPKITAAPQKSNPDFNNKIDVSALRQNASDSLLSGHGAIFSTVEEGNETTEGNIITDQKRKRFKLLPAMGMALRDWFFKQQRSVEKLLETKEVGPQISDVTNRQSVLKDAAERSALAPKDDYVNVAKRIKKVVRVNQAPTTLVIKKPEETKAPGWTYLEEEETEKAATVETKSEIIAPRETTIVNPIISEVPQTVTQAPPEPEVVVPEIKTPVAETEILPTVQPVAETVPEEKFIPEAETSTTWFPTSVNEEEKISVADKPEAAEPIRESVSIPGRTTVYAPANQPSPLGLWRVFAVATLAILLGVSVTLWWFQNDETVVVVNNENQFTALINADEEIPISLGSDRQTLLRNIAAVQPRPTSLALVIYPTVNLSGKEQPAATSDILSKLAWQAPGSFIRGVSDINFGLYKTSKPFIVLKVTSFDTAFGGILEWESLMSADLAPFFGQPVLGTFDPLARTATQIRDPYFVDTVVNNVDARLLNDEAQKERLIYAFANRNTIIITTDKSTLGDLLNLLR